MFVMTSLDAIFSRISRRSYTGALDDDTFKTLTDLTHDINAESGLTISLVQNGGTLFGGIHKTYGMFKGVRSFFVLAGPANDPYLKEKIGYYGEHLVLEATKLGLGTCWVGGTFDRSTLAKALKPELSLVCIITVGPVKETLSVKEKAIYKLTHSKQKTPSNMMQCDLAPPEWFVAGVTAASCAPSAYNKHPVTFVWEKGLAKAEIEGKNDVEWIDLGIAKLHFEIAALGHFPLGNSAIFNPLGETDICKI